MSSSLSFSFSVPSCAFRCHLFSLRYPSSSLVSAERDWGKARRRQEKRREKEKRKEKRYTKEERKEKRREKRKIKARKGGETRRTDEESKKRLTDEESKKRLIKERENDNTPNNDNKAVQYVPSVTQI